jgi:DNA methyltransferase 1-associated protein 1
MVTEYPFARYNGQSPDYTYSQDEYTKLLEGLRHNHHPAMRSHILIDPEWTKEETDYLFNLICEYDARFYIVNDRYEFPGGPPRSMEVRHSSRVWSFTYSRLL